MEIVLKRDEKFHDGSVNLNLIMKSNKNDTRSGFIGKYSIESALMLAILLMFRNQG